MLLPRLRPNDLPGLGDSGGEALAALAVTGTGSPWTVAVQVTDGDGDAIEGRFWVRLMIGAAEWDETSGDTITVTSASEQMVVDGQTIDVLTNADGTATLTITAGADRYVTAGVLGRNRSSGELTFASLGTPGEWQFNDTVNSGQILTIGL
jgi:hypothetical protein